MRRILSLLMVITTCYAACPNTGLVFRNSEWVTNNLIIKQFNFFYDTIALTAEDLCSPAKRFLSVFSLVKTIYLTTDSADVREALAIARAKAKKQLKHSAAAIAGSFRGAIDRILNVIDQPINDIFTACSPETNETDCQNALRDMRSKKEKLCKGYSKHTDFHKRTARLAGRPETIAYINEVNRMSTKKYNDSDIFDAFENFVTSKYKSTFEEIRNLFMLVKAGDLNCNVLSFINSGCA